MKKEYIYKVGEKSIEFSLLDSAKAFVVTDLETNEILVAFTNFHGVCVLEFQNIVIADETISAYKTQVVTLDAKKNDCDHNFWDCKYLSFECENVVNAVDIFCDACDCLTNVKINVLE